jgi:hypothetical protein
MNIQNANYSDGRMEIHGGIKGALCIFLLRVLKVITVKLTILLQSIHSFFFQSQKLVVTAFIGNWISSLFLLTYSGTSFTWALLASQEQCSAKYVKAGTSELGCNVLTPCIRPLFSVKRLWNSLIFCHSVLWMCTQKQWLDSIDNSCTYINSLRDLFPPLPAKSCTPL